MLQDGLDGQHGLPRARLAELARPLRRGAGGSPPPARRRASTGSTTWWTRARRFGQITTFAEGLGQAHDHVLVLGIGGSALGTKALLNALRRPAWNELDDEGREFFPRLTVLENVDPTTVAAALQRIDPRRVLVNVISKSGGTAETMAQYLVVRAWLEEALGAAAYRHLVFTTDPARGALRELAARDAIATLDVPPDVGGRFSVLSPVGLLPAALVGIDIDGAARRARGGRWSAPSRGRSAAQSGRAVRRAPLGRRHRPRRSHPCAHAVHRPPARARRVVPAALGREPGQAGGSRGAARCTSGPTPVAAVGATDQHSQVQLFMEGPFDKVDHLRVGGATSGST